ncbi:hypothetical protein RRG08_022714 [Elysia crispata]|uniref:Uncharacterized protein n=1 Tax=Elysia crispata TaxID=231223 RepID=A0AAE0ZEF2_9GAST|nr:hypothetical protein RRG08_022714 [Elysia crispata]
MFESLRPAECKECWTRNMSVQQSAWLDPCPLASLGVRPYTEKKFEKKIKSPQLQRSGVSMPGIETKRSVTLKTLVFRSYSDLRDERARDLGAERYGHGQAPPFSLLMGSHGSVTKDQDRAIISYRPGESYHLKIRVELSPPEDQDRAIISKELSSPTDQDKAIISYRPGYSCHLLQTRIELSSRTDQERTIISIELSSRTDQDRAIISYRSGESYHLLQIRIELSSRTDQDKAIISYRQGESYHLLQIRIELSSRTDQERAIFSYRQG